MSTEVIGHRMMRYLRTPKGLFSLVLALLTAIAGTQAGWRLVTPPLLGAIGGAMLLDAPIMRWRTGRWSYPDGALLTGWLVALVLSPHEPWPIALATAVVGIAGKHLVRVGRANVFNPAAFGLVGTFYLFDTGQSWWGALPELPSAWIAVLAVTGVFITRHLNKGPLVVAFLGVYYLLATLLAFTADPAHMAELYRAPDVHAALFFGFFMATDPPTSPPRHRDQLIYGTIAAVVSFATFRLLGAAWFLLAGVLAANLWEWWRKAAVLRNRPAAQGVVDRRAVAAA